MKVTVLQENLARGLGIVSKAVSPRSTLPVLANILIASDEGRLRLSATNLEMGVTCWIPARIEEEGSTTVPARTFNDLVSTTADRSGDVEARCENANLECARRHIHQRHQVHRRAGVPALTSSRLRRRGADQCR
ncbi:MAG: hypothetical protein MZV64_58970 [Ignavibacteriales bacterium]|nr:hypothetical protein [Ignavibacteriales bacterium]